MSLKPFANNYNYPLSAQDWARLATQTSVPKIVGGKGFQDLSMNQWHYCIQYKKINNMYPENSDLIEMYNIREKFKNHIVELASSLDEHIKRLAKMDEEIKSVEYWQENQ